MVQRLQHCTLSCLSQAFVEESLFHVGDAEWKAYSCSKSCFHNLTNVSCSWKWIRAGVGLQAQAWIYYALCWRSGNNLWKRTRVGQGGVENSFVKSGVPKALENHVTKKCGRSACWAYIMPPIHLTSNCRLWSS